MYLRKIRNSAIFALLFVMIAFSAALAADNEILAILELRAPAGINLNDVTLNLYPGTGTTGPITPNIRSADYFAYALGTAGTYNYRVTSTTNYYGVTKLLHITQAQIDNMNRITMTVHTGRRAANVNERFEAASVNIFNDEILNKLFTANPTTLPGFPVGGYQTPTFTTNKLQPYQYTTQQEMMSFIQNLANTNPRVHWFSLGKTNTMNYDIPIVIITTTNIPANATYEQAVKIIRENGKATFFHQGNIHGDEVSSTEGALAMILEMAGAYGTQYLDKIDFVCVPRFNVEGAARFTRSTLDPSIDMNRDHLRVRAQEVRMVHKAYLDLMPEVVLDGHEIGYFGVTATTAANTTVFATGGLTDIEATPSTSMNNPSSKVVDLALDVFAYNLHTKLNADPAGLRTNHYENASNGWTCNHGIGRAYYGLMGSVSMLLEVRGTGSLLMQRRTHAHVAVAKNMIETLHANAEQTKALVKEGREKVIALGKKYDPNNKIFLAQYASGNTGTYMSQGTENPGSKYSKYKTMRHQSDIFGNITGPTGNNNVLKAHAINDKSHRDRSRPTAYIIPKGITSTSINSGDYAINYDYLKEMMDANRIEYYELKPGITASVRQYYYVSGTPSASASTGATLSNQVLLANIRDEAKVKFTDGAYVIPMDQVAGAVIMCTFEPDIANSNGFNGTVTQSLTGAEGLALIFHSLTTNNYPYYRLEKDNPRIILPSVDCKENVHNIIDHLNEHGCNVGFGLVLILLVPFILRRK